MNRIDALKNIQSVIDCFEQGGDVENTRMWREVQAALLPPAERGVFQGLVADWMNAVFEGQGGKDRETRNFRFLEEALELVQSLGCTRAQVNEMADYVYARPVGKPAQEVGGVAITLMALCTQAGIDAREAGYVELQRVWLPGVMAKIRAKQKSKPGGDSPLPGTGDTPALLATLAGKDIDVADHVHHRPTGEDWVVGCVHGLSLYPCGWPETRAELKDCALIKKASTGERDELLMELANSYPNRVATQQARERLGIFV